MSEYSCYLLLGSFGEFSWLDWLGIVLKLAASLILRRSTQRQLGYIGGEGGSGTPMAAHRARAISSSPSRFGVIPSSPILTPPFRYKMMAATYPQSPFNSSCGAVDKENRNRIDSKTPFSYNNGNNYNDSPRSIPTLSMDDQKFVLSPQLPFLISPANITCSLIGTRDVNRSSGRPGGHRTKLTTNLETTRNGAIKGGKLGGIGGGAEGEGRRGVNVNITTEGEIAKTPPDLSSLVLPSPVLYLNVSHPSYIPGRVPRHPVTMYRPTMVVPSLDAYPKIFNISSLRLPFTEENNYPR